MDAGEKFKTKYQVFVRKFPKRKHLFGSISNAVSPLDMFYTYVMGNVMPESGLRLYPKSCHIHPDDARTLYVLFRDFMMIYFGGESGRTQAQEKWIHYGPVENPSVPKGYIVLEDDYLLMADDVNNHGENSQQRNFDS